MICKRGWKGLVVFTALLALSLLFSAAVAAATVDDVVNNSLRIGDDIYELNHTIGYTYENVLASLDRGGANYYFKIDHRWYDLTRDDINTLSDLLDLEKAVPAAEVRTWDLTYRYGAGDTREELAPLASTYIFDYSLPDAAVLEAEDTEVTVGLRTNELGAIGYEAAQIAFSAAGPGEVSFKTVDDGGEYTFKDEGCLDAFALPAEYAGSMKWTLCFSSAGDYTVTFRLVGQGTGEVIAKGVRVIRVYPSPETVLAKLEARILTALGTLEPEGSGVSGVDYAAGEASVNIDEPGRLVHGFVQSLVTAFKVPLNDVSVAAFYAGGEKIGTIEDPAAMSDAGLIAAIGRELIEPLIGGEQSWSEAALGGLEGKSADVELTVALGAARYRAVYGVNFAINRYSVNVDSQNGTVVGTGSYAVGAEVDLEATAGAGYEFYSWSDGDGEKISRSNPYTLTMPNRDLELTANFFRAGATVEQDSTLDGSYIRVEVEGENITLDLGGNTVVHLSITGSNVVLQNGTVINLQIGRDVENVVLKDISDEAGSSHIFAGGGSGSIILEGHTVLKGTVQITSRTALGICSRSADSMIGGDIVVETIMPVMIAAPVQGEIRVLASSETIAVNAEVSRITALADAVIKISSAIDESKRPQVEKAAGVEVTVSIVDEQGEETGETGDVEVGAELSPAAIFIFSIAPVADEIKVGGSYTLPAAMEAVLSDRSTVNLPVEWYPAAADTGEAGVYPFNGTVEGYDEAVGLTLTVYRTHLVSFEVGGGSAVDEQEVRHGEAAVEPAAPTRKGYTFGGWYKDQAFDHPWDFDEGRVTGALTLYARWTANIYEVTFDPRGGNKPAPASIEATYDSAYGELAVTAREGYTFAGWFTEADGGIEIAAANRVSTAGDHTLYAHWDINQYTITFDSAGGSEIEPLTQDYGTAITAPAEPLKEGYHFMGWQPALPATMPAGDLVLTAQWSIKTYTVNFLDHDDALLDTQTVNHGSSAEAPADPERVGYTFTGWDKGFANVTGDLTITAIYKINRYTVTFVDHDDEVLDTQIVEHGSAATAPTVPVREGYTFTGWDPSFGEVTGDLIVTAQYEVIDYTLTIQYEYADGSEAAESHTETLNIGDGYEVVSPPLTGYTADRQTVSGTMPAGDVTVTVIYTINSYSVTFEDFDGTVLDTQTVDHGSSAEAPAEPKREGYTFTGWGQEFANVTGDLTITATYAINVYTVTFVDHDETVLDTQTVEHGSAATAPTVPVREGYTFTGWDPSFGEVTGDLIVTAKYIDQLLVGIRDLIASNGDRTRADYTYGIAEWNNYWGSFCTALTDAGQLYAELKDAETLTEEQRLSVIAAEEELQRAVEIIDGIEDFDLALGGRVSPKGLVETVYERSLVADEFQPGRIRCYYERESGKFSWMLSGFVQEQGLYEGTTGTGMNPGLQNVMLSESIVKLQSGEHVINIYKADGTRKTKGELENDGIALATHWLEQAEITSWFYASLVGLVEDCKLIGRTSDGVEFERTYSFRFVDGGTYLFDPHFRYCVIDDLVQKDFEGCSVINVTRGLKYTGGTIQAAVDAANPGDYIHVAAGNYNESITINKSINLIGNYREGIGAHATILDGTGIDGAPGIHIAAGVSDVSISGFEITGFASGGILGEGSGISNITIEDNFIHDVGGDAIHGGSDISEASAGWTVAGNKIEGFGGSGVIFDNIGGLLISDNSITGPAGSDGFAIGITARAYSGTMKMLGIAITGNEITGGVINVTAIAEGSGTAEFKIENVDINGNTIVDGSVEVQSGAEGGRTARIDHVRINDNHVDFQDRAVSVGTLAYPGSAHIRYITIKNNEMTGHSTAIDLTTESGYSNMREFAITGNNLTITDPERSGCAVNLTGAKGSVNNPNNFTNNIVTVVGCADGTFDGINISGKDTARWNLTGNKVIGSNVGANSSGIRLGGDLPKVTVNVEKNTITGWRQGIQASSLVADSAVKIYRNLIHGNTDFGVSNGSGAPIDAALNYWGHASGPKHSTNPGGQGNAVTNNVDFDPWYLDEDFADRSDGAVHNARLNRYYREIQAAVDDAASGDTIKVKTGLFNEGVTITKSITLIGVKGDSKTAGPGANAPIIDGAGLGDNVSGILISGDARNVIIEGFEIRNFTGDGTSGVVGHGELLSAVTIRYNYIHHVAGSGVYVTNAGGVEAVTGWSIAYNKIEDVGDSGIYFDGIYTAGDGAAEWLIDDNILDGNGISSAGFRCTDVSTTANIEMNRNTVTGWTCGVWIFADDIAVTLRSNLFYNNGSWGVSSEDSYVDAALNFWGHEDGPLGGSNGDGIAGTVSYEPWYVDEGCTVKSDAGTIDQLQVDAAIALVPAKIASVQVPGGNSASAEEKGAAVKAYIENLEGMAILRVTVTVEAGSSSGYKVTITRGEATPGIKDNIEVTFVAPIDDQEAAEIVEGMIDDLPLAKNVNLDNYLDYLAAIEEADAAFSALTEDQKVLVDSYLATKLNVLLTKIEELMNEGFG